MEPAASLTQESDSAALTARSSGWQFAAPEYYTLALIVSVAIATYIFVTGDAQSERLLTPALVAAIMVVNLVPAMALIVLVGSRIARGRAERTMAGGNGRLHVRLVALFSLIAAAPTLLVVIFASLLFQYGVDFWFSDRSRGMFENAANLAEGYYQENQRQVGANTFAMATDLGKQLTQFPVDSPKFYNYYLQQVVVRSLNESAIIEVGQDGVARTAAAIDPDKRAAESRLTPTMVSRLNAGQDVVVIRQSDRIEAAARLPGTERGYVYASRDANVPGFQQSARAGAVLADYNDLFERSQQLQLQFNGALYLGSLLLLALAVIAGIVVADRIVRPLGTLIGATRTAAGGDLSVRVTPPGREDEIAVLTRAFNRMTEQLEGQTGALVSVNEQLEARRSFIEAVLSGVSSAVVSVDAGHRILLANAAAERLIGQSAADLTGQSLADVAPELAKLLSGDEREGVVQLARRDAEPATLAAKAVAQGDGFVLSFEDITQQLLDQRRAAWSDVARRIAHEIKNPLTPIQLAAERLRRRYGKEIENDKATFERLTDTIVRQVGDLRRMVDEFSSFARMPKPVFRREVLVDIARQALFLHEVAHPLVRFTLDSPDLSPEIICDRRQLGQALTNIVKNAVEAIEARGEGGGDPGFVAMTVEMPSEGSIRIAVADNGIGLPAERDRLVEPYMTTRARGTGLGLAIVKKIVEEHCGTIAFADREGGGTVVAIMLDLAMLSTLDAGDSPAAASGGDAPPMALTRMRND